MQSAFIENTLKIVVASICQNIGFQGIYSTPLNVLVDLLHRYLREIAVTTHQYSEHDGRTLPNLDDLEMAFKVMGISVSELEEYVSNVDPVPHTHEVPKLPLYRPSNLNFLKPGAKEIVSRPLHVNEHLPPMFPEKEDAVADSNTSCQPLEDNGESNPGTDECISPSQIKRGSDNDASPIKRIKINIEAEGEPVREIDSVMMTTSGFISSAREGKMPEAKRPNLPLPSSRSNSPVSKSPSSLIKKKVTMEKIIRHKNHIGGIRPGHLPKSSKSRDMKFKPKPKIPLAPPGTGSLGHIRAPGGMPPKLKIPVPQSKPDKPPETPEKEKSAITEKQEKRRLRDEKRREQRRRERREKEKNNVDFKDNKDRVRVRMKGLTKEEELKRYKERENELIAKLAASSAVTVTSIPPPSLRVREKTPENEQTPSSAPSSGSSSDSKSKLSIFKKSSKGGKESKHHSRDASPTLTIDTPTIKEEPISPPSSPALDFTNFPHESPLLPPVPKTPDVPSVKKVKSRSSTKVKTDRSLKSPKSTTTKVSPRVRKKSTPKAKPQTPDRPKTPQGEVEPAPFTFPNAPAFIPPFSPFAFNMDPISHMFMGPIGKKDSIIGGDERPPTPSHDLGSPLGLNMSDRSVPDLPETPKLLVKEPPPLPITPKNMEKSKLKTDKEKKKEHKKEKKQKEKEKIKKKRDKEKAKEEKKKEKERLKQEKREKKKKVRKETASKAKESVPKLTLQFRAEGKDEKSTSSEIKHTPKLVIKPVLKHPSEDISLPPSLGEKRSRPLSASPPPTPIRSVKIASLDKPGSPPQIAKFSALITRPKKGSQSKKSLSKELTVPPLKIKDPSLKLAKKEFSIKPPKKPKASSISPTPPPLIAPMSPPSVSTVPPLKIKSAGINKFAEEKKSSSKKSEKKKKRPMSPLSISPPPPLEIVRSSPPPPPLSPPRKKPCVMPPPSPPSPSPDPPPSKPSSGLLTETVGPIGHFVDDQGNEVWICPTCGKQDDGSPMIGCDTCDDWYHWLCVGIHVPPNERENWYCPRCLSHHKQRGSIPDKKKRGRKRKFPPI